MKKYTVALGLTLVMTSQSVFGMAETKAPKPSGSNEAADLTQAMGKLSLHDQKKVTINNGKMGGSRKPSIGEDKYYSTLAAEYVQARKNKVKAACGPNAQEQQLKPLYNVLVEVIAQDMKDCRASWKQVLPFLRQNAMNPQVDIWANYPKNLAGFTYTEDDDEQDVDTTSFHHFAASALIHSLWPGCASKLGKQDFTEQEMMQLFYTSYSEVQQQLLLIAQAQKLATAVLNHVKQKRNTQQYSVVQKTKSDEKDDVALPRNYVSERFDILVAAYGPNAKEYTNILYGTLMGIIRNDMVECMSLCQRLIPTFEHAVNQCEYLQDEKDARARNDELLQTLTIDQNMKRYICSIDGNQDPFYFYLDTIIERQCRKELDKKEVTYEEVLSWLDKTYPLAVQQRLIYLQYAHDFAGLVFEIL